MKNRGKLSAKKHITLINKGKSDLLINLKRELFTLDSGRADSEMDLESNNGQMALNIVENGKRTGHMEKEGLFM